MGCCESRSVEKQLDNAVNSPSTNQPTNSGIELQVNVHQPQSQQTQWEKPVVTATHQIVQIVQPQQVYQTQQVQPQQPQRIYQSQQAQPQQAQSQKAQSQQQQQQTNPIYVIDDLKNEIDDGEMYQDERSFAWYRQSHGDNVKFKDKKKNKIQLCGKNKKKETESEIASIGYIINLNSDSIAQLSFQVTLNDLNHSLMIGFVFPDELGAPAVSDWHTNLCQSDGFGFTVFKGQKYIEINKSYDKFPQIIIPQQKIYIPNIKKIQSGDNIRVVVDGQRKSVRIYHNKSKYGITLFENIPKMLMPAVSCYTKTEKCSIILKQRKYYKQLQEENKVQSQESQNRKKSTAQRFKGWVGGKLDELKEKINEVIEDAKKDLDEVLPIAKKAGMKFGKVSMKLGTTSSMIMRISTKKDGIWDDKFIESIDLGIFGKILAGVLKQVDKLRQKCGKIDAKLTIISNVMHGGIPEPTLMMRFNAEKARQMTYNEMNDDENQEENNGDDDQEENKGNEDQEENNDDENKQENKEDGEDEENKDKEKDDDKKSAKSTKSTKSSKSPKSSKTREKISKKLQKKIEEKIQKFEDWVGKKVDDLMIQLAVMAPAMEYAGIEIEDISIKVGAKSGFGMTIKVSKGEGRWDENMIDTENKDYNHYLGKGLSIAFSQIDKAKQILPDLRASIEAIIHFGCLPDPKLQIHFTPKPDKDQEEEDSEEEEEEESEEDSEGNDGGGD